MIRSAVRTTLRSLLRSDLVAEMIQTVIDVQRMDSMNLNDSTAVKVHDHLHGFERVKLQVVKTAPDSQLLNLLSVSRLNPVLNEADQCGAVQTSVA